MNFPGRILRFLSGAVFLVIGILYSIFAEPVHLATSRVVILRNKLENPDNASDEARNRWIWARDGLNMSSALVTDDLMKKFLKENRAYLQKISGEQNDSGLISELKKSVKVQFTGADEFNYQIEVRHYDPKIAVLLNRYVFDFLRFMAIEKDNQDFNSVVSQLIDQSSKFHEKSQEYTYYQNKILKLKFEHTLSHLQRINGFRIIAHPRLLEQPIWPKPIPIILGLTLFGFFLGSFGVFLLAPKKIVI